MTNLRFCTAMVIADDSILDGVLSSPADALKMRGRLKRASE
jgi:hypothetical protein